MDRAVMFPTHVLDSLKYLFFPTQFIKLDEQLSLALSHLAEEEEQPFNEVGKKMLSLALRHHRQATRNLGLWESLTPREKEITALACLSYTNKEIADSLFISENTVKTHLRNIMDKLHLANRSQAAAYAVKTGLVQYKE